MRPLTVALLAVFVVGALCAPCFCQTVILRDAPAVVFPANTDSNSPSHWDGETLYVFNSQGNPTVSSGPDQFHLANPIKGEWSNTRNGGRWIEATWKAADGTLYGWYHFEPRGVCPGTRLTAPRIGAAKSADNGAHWTDLGIVLEAPAGTIDCDAKNGFFAGGHGDFSIMLDKEAKYLYLFYSNYAGRLVEQGVAVARMQWQYREKPVGRFRKYYDGKWEQPGIGGHSWPIYPAKSPWVYAKNDAFWGPSVHWNTHLNCYVIMLNHVLGGPGWPNEGIYISYGADLANPKGWSAAVKIGEGHWYPQVIGLNKAAKETDKLCGQVGRLYSHGTSKKEIVFLKEGEDPAKAPPVYEFSKP